jgi:hypothetical protein
LEGKAVGGIKIAPRRTQRAQKKAGRIPVPRNHWIPELAAVEFPRAFLRVLRGVKDSTAEDAESAEEDWRIPESGTLRFQTWRRLNRLGLTSASSAVKSHTGIMPTDDLSRFCAEVSTGAGLIRAGPHLQAPIRPASRGETK